MASETVRKIFQHQNANHFKYQKVTAPWFGPIKRAFEALQNVQNNPLLSEEQFLDYIFENHFDIYQNMEWLTFQEFHVKETQWRKLELPAEGFKFRLARVNVRPDPKYRNKLFDIREKIAADTGWYPLVMGSRAQLSNAYIQRLRGIRARQVPANYGFLLGNLCGVRNVSKKIEKTNGDGTSSDLIGTAILLEGTKGSLLLDTGFAVDFETIGRPRAIFLSHLHQDHTGGYWEALQKLNSFTMLSDATLAYLFNKSNLSHEQLDKFLTSVYVIDSADYKIMTDGHLETFQVFHAPGSYGIVYRDSQGKALFYPGDLCLNNGFLNTSQKLFSYIVNFDAQQKAVLLDAAMVRKRDYSIALEDTPSEILEHLIQGANNRDVFFVTRSIETLVYAFLQAFHETRLSDSTVKLIVNDELLLLTRRLIHPVLSRKHDKLDPFVRELIRGSIENFTESHRVYPLSALNTFETGDNVVIFASKSDLQSNALLAARLRNSDVVIAGVDAVRDDLELLKLTRACRNVRRVASPKWSFHSSESELADFIRQLSGEGIQSILFHNGSDNLKKWIKSEGLNPDFVTPLRHAVTPL